MRAGRRRRGDVLRALRAVAVILVHRPALLLLLADDVVDQILTRERAETDDQRMAKKRDMAGTKLAIIGE
jgi:hypothetical protein